MNDFYYGFDPKLVKLRAKAKELCAALNASKTREERIPIMRELFQEDNLSDEEMPWIEPPFYCDYGFNIKFGKNSYLNFNCVILDCNVVEIGANTLFGPGVQVYTAQHPVDPVLRNGLQGPELAYKVTIGSDCWIGGCAILNPGVEIGNGCTVGSGSVVTKKIPEFCIAYGNPAKFHQLHHTDEPQPKKHMQGVYYSQ